MMASAGNIVYAESSGVNEIDENEVRRSSSLETATATASEEAQGGENQEQKAFLEQTERLLACPCLDDLKQGPCGNTFKDAFRCFILSKEAEKGAECAEEFTNLEVCMMRNKEMFKKAEDRKIPPKVPKIPPVPASGLNFNEKIANWSKKERRKG